MKPQLQS